MRIQRKSPPWGAETHPGSSEEATQSKEQGLGVSGGGSAHTSVWFLVFFGFFSQNWTPFTSWGWMAGQGSAGGAGLEGGDGSRGPPSPRLDLSSALGPGRDPLELLLGCGGHPERSEATLAPGQVPVSPCVTQHSVVSLGMDPCVTVTQHSVICPCYWAQVPVSPSTLCCPPITGDRSLYHPAQCGVSLS